MIVLAFDASPKNIGYAIFDDGQPVERGKITFEKKDLKNEKFQKLTIFSNNYPSINQTRKIGIDDNIWPWFCKAVQVVLRTIQTQIGMPDHVAMDTYFFRPSFNANTSTIFGVAEVTGALMFAIYQYFGLETIRTALSAKYGQFSKRPEFIALKKKRQEAKDKLKAHKEQRAVLTKDEIKLNKRILDDSTANKKALAEVLMDIYKLSKMSLDEADAMGLARYIYNKKSRETGSLL